LIAFVGCGGNGGDEMTTRSTTTVGEPPPRSRELVADTVNRMFAAWRAGDGEEACSYMSDFGRDLMPKIAAQFRPPVVADTCEEAVAESAARSKGTGIEDRITPDEVTISENPLEAEALGEMRGAVQLQLVEGEWLGAAPYFVD
jgi:hypothetical protein